MIKLALRPSSPFISFPSIWEDEDNWPTPGNQSGLDIYETDSDVVVKAAVPGISANDIDVTFEDGVLRISARKDEAIEEKEKKKVVYQERRMTSFSYTTTLPRAIDSSKINAEVEDGVVTVTAPLVPEAKPKKIAVKAKNK